jgi:glycosyltransferase involved in cell wall biosynthesis
MIKKRLFPRISIVTPTYNQGEYIEETIKSIIEQNYPNLEYVIIDGGSTDGTVDIIKKYEKHLKYWVSEPDEGQAHAINKGLKHCTGEIFNWVNSDDYLASGALRVIVDAFRNPKVDVVAGGATYFQGEVFEKPIPLAKLTAKGLMRWNQGVQFVQPALWMRRSHFVDCGGVDKQFHYAFDWDLVIRYLHKFPKVLYVPDVLVYFRLHDESKTVSSLEKFHVEEEQILEKIASLPEFKKLKKSALGRRVREEWFKELERCTQSTSPRHHKILTIIKKSLLCPSEKWNRVTLGAIRKILFQNSKK